MDKEKQHNTAPEQHLHRLKPYTFRSNMMLALLICSLLASAISLVLAFCFSHINLLDELRMREHTLAVNLLAVEQRADIALTLDELLHMEQDGLTLTLVTEQLPKNLLQELRQRTIYTHYGNLAYAPITYVQLSKDIVRIAPGKDNNLFWITFLRVSFAALSFLAVFAMMITLATARLSRPVHALTEAMVQVKSGDFTMRLPDDKPGEIGDMMRSFNAMTEGLGRTAYLQKDFISSVSHEFKTPIASIRGFARLLQMPGLTQEQRSEYVTLIAQESDRLSRLSETLLRLTALEQQTAPASLSTFSLDEQLRQVILRLEPAWSTRNINWQLELENLTIETDEALLNHVWINLIQNAIKFSPEGGTIEARVERTDRAVVEITDHGIGMDDETRKRIFDRFYQADKSRTQEGVGLGLCLVKRILDMLGGDISVRSKLGEGSTFRVRLPLRPVHQHNSFTEDSDHERHNEPHAANVR